MTVFGPWETPGIPGSEQRTAAIELLQSVLFWDRGEIGRDCRFRRAGVACPGGSGSVGCSDQAVFGCESSGLRGTVLSNLRVSCQAFGGCGDQRQIRQQRIVGETFWFRLICGFVRFPAGLRLFLNLFCRLFRLNEVMRSWTAPAGTSCRICRKTAIFLDKV